LKRVLSTADAWICGLRKSQSLTRENINIFEWDATHKMYKVNPLAHWSEEAVWEYILDRQVPYNQLYSKNFPSIGCRPCTRAIEPEEDVRSGRWWWEEPEKKECGLHIRMEES
jgi:phosphoadenosine phosphosulfate reductase